MSDPVISIKGLRKSYGDTEAVRGIDLEVDRGEIFAFLGPNGAGKTTTVEILEGYRKRSGGEVSVLGVDPQQAGRDWRERIGIVLQSGRLDPYLTVRESLDLYAGYFRAPRPTDEVIALVGLESKAGERTGRLSGGQQRRLDVGMALVGDPELLFLDEPTTGFDPSARRQAWSTIKDLCALGKTVFLTTHFMDEAQALADRVAVMVDGRIVALGTPGEIGGRDTAPTEIDFALPAHVALGDLPALESAGVTETAPGRLRVVTREGLRTAHELTGWALERGLELRGFAVSQPSLEDVYLRLTENQEATSR